MFVSRHLTYRFVLVGVAGATIAAAVLPAGATTTTTTTPAKGIATSTVTLLKLQVAGQTVTTGQVTALADNAVSPHKVQLVVTPLDSTLTNGPVGQQTITPANSPATIAAPTTAATLPGGLGSVTGPAMQVGAEDGATGLIATVTASALGTVNLLNVPIDLQTSTLSDTAKVVAGSASAAKTISVGTIGLPSVSDLLKALGLDLTKTLDQLTQGNLTKLVGIVGGNVATLNSAVDTAQSALTTAGQTAADTLAGAQAQVAPAAGAVTAANSAFTGAWTTAFNGLSLVNQSTVNTALTALGLSATTLTAAQYLSLPSATVTTLGAVLNTTALSTLASAVSAAQNVVTLVNNLVDALQALVNGVLAAVTGNTNPLAAIGGVKLSTSALAASTPTADATISVGSLDVLGAASTISTFTSTLGGLTQTLKDVLGSVGVTFTPPAISAGTPQHSTSTTGTTRHATASVTGLTVTLPTLTAPAALSLAGTALSTPAGSLTVGQLSEVAQWTPSSSTTTTSTTPGTKKPTHQPSQQPTGSPSLAHTGSNVLLPLVAFVLVAAGLLARRRFTHAPEA